MKTPEDEIVYALDAIQEPICLFETVYHDGGDPIYVMDQVKDEKGEDSAWVQEISINESIQKLSQREQAIIRMRFFEGKTQMEVAQEIGISQAQVSRLEKAALIQMKQHMSL